MSVTDSHQNIWRKTAKLTNSYWKTSKKCSIPTHPLINSGLKFFQTIAQYSNDALYWLLPSFNKLETLIDFEETANKTNFWHLIPLNPKIRIFFKISAMSLSLLYRSLTSCKISEKNNERSTISKDGWTDQQTDPLTDGLTPKGRKGIGCKYWCIMCAYGKLYQARIISNTLPTNLNL